MIGKVYTKLFAGIYAIMILSFWGCDNKQYKTSQWVDLDLLRFDIVDKKLDSVTDLYETYIITHECKANQ